MSMPRIRVFKALDESGTYATAFCDAKGRLLPVFMQFVSSSPEQAQAKAEAWWQEQQEKAARPKGPPRRPVQEPTDADIFG